MTNEIFSGLRRIGKVPFERGPWLERWEYPRKTCRRIPTRGYVSALLSVRRRVPQPIAYTLALWMNWGRSLSCEQIGNPSWKEVRKWMGFLLNVVSCYGALFIWLIPRTFSFRREWDVGECELSPWWTHRVTFSACRTSSGRTFLAPSLGTHWSDEFERWTSALCQCHLEVGRVWKLFSKQRSRQGQVGCNIYRWLTLHLALRA